MASLIYKLKVSGRTVCETPSATGAHCQRGTVGQVSLVSLKGDYDNPWELIVRVDRDPWQPEFAADSTVELLVDNVRRFSGLCGACQPSLAHGRSASQQYVCRDAASALRNAPLIGQWDQQTIWLRPGKLSDVLAQYLPYVDDELTRLGLDTEFSYDGGAENAQVLPVTLTAGNVDGGFREIAAAALGVRCLIDASSSPARYRFIQVYQAPTYDLAFESVRIPEFDPQISFEGRCGAVRTCHQSDKADAERTAQFEMQPAWPKDHKEEEKWSPHRVTMVTMTSPHPEDIPGAPETPLADRPKASDSLATDITFRLYSFKAFADARAISNMGTRIEEGMPAIAVCYPQEEHEGYGGAPRFIEIEKWDWSAKTVLLKYPAIAIPADNSRGQSFGWPGTFERGVGKPGTVHLRFIFTGKVSLDFKAIRVPPADYAGRAFMMMPATCACEKRISIPAGVDKQEYCQQAFRVWSEPACTGKVPISGDLPADLWGLGRRINLVRESGGPIGYEQLAAPLMGINVRFEGGGQADLEFSTDTSMLLRGGQG